MRPVTSIWPQNRPMSRCLNQSRAARNRYHTDRFARMLATEKNSAQLQIQRRERCRATQPTTSITEKLSLQTLSVADWLSESEPETAMWDTR